MVCSYVSKVLCVCLSCWLLLLILISVPVCFLNFAWTLFVSLGIIKGNYLRFDLNVRFSGMCVYLHCLQRYDLNPVFCLCQTAWEWNLELKTRLTARDSFSFSNTWNRVAVEILVTSSLLLITAHILFASEVSVVEDLFLQLGWAPHSIASLGFRANPTQLSHFE